MSLFEKVKSHYDEALKVTTKPPREMTGTEKKTMKVLLSILLLIILVSSYFGYKYYRSGKTCG